MRFIEYFVRYERLGDEIDVVDEIHDQAWLIYFVRGINLHLVAVQTVTTAGDTGGRTLNC